MRPKKVRYTAGCLQCVQDDMCVPFQRETTSGEFRETPPESVLPAADKPLHARARHRVTLAR